MGWMDKAVAGAKVAKENAKKLSQEVLEDLDATYGDDERFVAARQAARDLRTKAGAAVADARELKNEALDEFAQTQKGKAFGEGARKGVAALAGLPILSALADGLQARHGVPQLYQEFLADPQHPMRAVHLAEAMGRAQRDMRTYRTVRSLTSISYLAVSQGVRASTSISDEPLDPTEVRILKIAFAQSVRRLRADRKDVEANHALARVYLAQGMHDQCLRFSQTAILLNPNDGLPWVTLARAHIEMGDLATAIRASEMAVARGATYGHETLAVARLRMADPGTMDDVRAYERTKGLVKPADREAYLGFAAELSAVMELVKAEQITKIERLKEKAS